METEITRGRFAVLKKTVKILLFVKMEVSYNETWNVDASDKILKEERCLGNNVEPLYSPEQNLSLPLKNTDVIYNTHHMTCPE